MALNMTIVQTSGVGTTDYSDVADDLALAAQTLADMPVNNAVVLDFEDAKSARLFVKQGKAWATDNGLTFVRKPSGQDEKISDTPTRVTFRIYVPRDKNEDTEAE